jgi:hypothetical protein
LPSEPFNRQGRMHRFHPLLGKKKLNDREGLHARAGG